MSKIPYPVIKEKNDEIYIVQENYTVDLPVTGDALTIGKGFDYDGASIPRAFWSIIGCPFTGTQTRPALVHDALYAGEIYDRATCDRIFFVLLDDCGCDWLKRNALWLAVRIFGGFVWKKHKKSKVSRYRSIITLTKWSK